MHEPPTAPRFDGDPEGLARTPTEADRAAPHPLYCIWELTLRCDLACRHCGSRAGKGRAAELSTEACLAIVEQLAEVGVREVTLLGGEAYLRTDWPTIARAISERGMICGLLSGGRNLTAERVGQAADAGVRTICISLDGLARTHDAQRGVAGSFRAALAACENVVRRGLSLVNNTQLNRLSAPELPALGQLLARLGSTGWQVQLSVPMGHAADRPAFLLQPYELLELFPLLAWVKQRILTPAGVSLFPGNNVGYFGPFEAALRYGGERGAHWTGCQAGEWVLGIEADGTVKGCSSLPSESYGKGSLSTARLATLLAETPGFAALARRGRESLSGFCRDCYYAEICRGGCCWTAHCFLGAPGNNPYCIHRALELESRGLRERVVRVAPPPGRPFDHGRFELVVEPAEDSSGEPRIEPRAPSIAGFPLDDALALTPESPGAWPAETLEAWLGII